MSDGIIISAYGSHNATLAMYHNGKYTVVEVERWANRKNSGLTGYLPLKNPQQAIDDIMEYLFEIAGTRKINLFLDNYFAKIDLTKYDIENFQKFDHHAAHAAGAYYQSKFTQALTFTYDGGGNGSYFNVYLSEKREVKPKLIAKFNIDLGFPYMILADHMEDITRDPLNIGNLVYAGKLMGLCAYGEVNLEWLPHFENFYNKFRYDGNSYVGGLEARIDATNELMTNIGVDMDTFNVETTRFSGKFSWDIAATSQRAFENVFVKLITPFIEQYKNYPICLSGGCALNVILNSKLIEIVKHDNVFIPPNPNDCGIAIGGLLEYIKPINPVDITYSGLPILDADDYTELMENNPVDFIEDITIDDIATLLSNNYIVGVINGNSEHGPRALGNRSILCNPVGNMKDILNKKVKNREWYRPFAPVVRLEDVSTYFEFTAESQHMTFIAKVKEEYSFPAITHVDGTGRLQTVTQEQNQFLYDIVTSFKEKTGYGVILNTSFNVNGKPILTRLRDAITILMTTDLDCVYYDKKLIFKNDKTSKLNNLLRYKHISMDHTNYTLYILAYTRTEDEFDELSSKINALQNMHSKSVVIVNDGHEGRFNPNEDTHVITLDNHKIFYSEMLTSMGFGGNEIDFIKPLWLKDIIDENPLESDYHIVVDLTVPDAEDHFRKFYSKYMGTANLVDRIIIDKDTSIVNNLDFISKQRNYDIKINFPRFGIYAGYTASMLWMLRTYEGNLRYHILYNRGKNDKDFLAIQFLEHMSRFLLLDEAA